MANKLTLRLNERLIKNAKRHARANKISLSRLVSDYFKYILSQEKEDEITSPILLEITGILSSKIDAKKLRKKYNKHLEEKYL